MQNDTTLRLRSKQKSKSLNHRSSKSLKISYNNFAMNIFYFMAQQITCFLTGMGILLAKGNYSA